MLGAARLLSPALHTHAAQLLRPTSPTPTPPSTCRRLAAEDTGDVFLTDGVLTTLMCATRSVYPWDIVITKRGEQLWFDKRPNSSLDFLTNGETAPDPLEEKEGDVNGVRQLSLEATAVNQAFREQVGGRLGAVGRQAADRV